MKFVFIAGKFKAMVYFPESLVQWSSMWEEVKNTVTKTKIYFWSWSQGFALVWQNEPLKLSIAYVISAKLISRNTGNLISLLSTNFS